MSRAREATVAQRRRAVGSPDFHALGAYYFPENTRLSELLATPDGVDLGAELAAASR